MKLVRVGLGIGYTVPNTPAYIAEARAALLQDVYDAVKYNELESWIFLMEAPPEHTEDDVPDFLKELVEED